MGLKKDGVLKHGQMEESLKGNFRKAKNKERGNLNGLMALHLRGI